MNPTVQLLQFLLLANFPSGSSVNYHADKLYLFGDDAQTILVLDKDYQALDSIRLFDYPEKRIPKSEKADLESSAIVSIAGTTHLLALGSASTEARKKFLLVPLRSDGLIDHKARVVLDNVEEFVARVAQAGIKEVNLEGAIAKEGSLILANRGNKNYPMNYLIVTEANFWVRQKESTLRIVPIELSESEGDFLGISELCYIKPRDILLFTFTSETTTNAYDDGVIGSSYIGWTRNVSTNLKHSKLKVDGMLNLSNASPEFKNQKIEGICLEQAGKDEFLLHLISDNDNGESKLFKVLLKF